MRKLLIEVLTALGVLWSLFAQSPLHAQQPVVPYVSAPPGGVATPVQHAHTAALAASLLVKNAPGTVAGFNCTAITGGAAGYCVAYDASSVPSTGALTGALVLDVCYFDTSARGCSLAHLPNGIVSAHGIVVLLTSAATPFTYTTGTDTGYISADYN